MLPVGCRATLVLQRYDPADRRNIFVPKCVVLGAKKAPAPPVRLLGIGPSSITRRLMNAVTLSEPSQAYSSNPSLL